MAYVPDGLTEQEWNAMKKKKAEAQAKNKKYYKEKKFEVSLRLGCCLFLWLIASILLDHLDAERSSTKTYL